MQIFGTSLSMINDLHEQFGGDKLLRLFPENNARAILLETMPLEPKFQTKEAFQLNRTMDTEILPIRLKLAVYNAMDYNWFLMDNASSYASEEECKKQGRTAHMLGGLLDADMMLGTYTRAISYWQPYDIIRFLTGKLVYDEYDMGLASEQRSEIDHLLLKALMKGSFSYFEFATLLNLLGISPNMKRQNMYLMHISETFGITIVTAVAAQVMIPKNGIVDMVRLSPGSQKFCVASVLRHHPKNDGNLYYNDPTPVEFYTTTNRNVVCSHDISAYGAELMSAIIDTELHKMIL